MKVAELINELKKFPEDCDVYGATNEDGFDESNRFHINACEKVNCRNYEQAIVIFNNVS